MKITSKTRSYYCDEDGWHSYRKASRLHRVAGPAYIGSGYYRSWYHKDHTSRCFQETGPGGIYLNGNSNIHHINGKPCFKEEYEDYCKSQKL